MIWIISVGALSIITIFFLDRLIRSFRVSNYWNKYVMITGCSSGFGEALARHLDNLGFNVFAGCRSAQAMEALSKNSSGRLLPILIDVRENQSIESALAEVKRILPEGRGLWGLVNNAGVLGIVGISEVLTREDFHKVFEVNLFGLIETTRHFLPLVRQARGRVVNMSSIAGRIAFLSGAYGTSKFGVEAYSDLLRREMYHRGVKVCVLEPGGYKTSFSDFNNLTPYLVQLFDERATEEMKQCYGNVRKLYDKLIASQVQYVPNDISPVVEAYTHALTSSFPRTRYYVGKDANFLRLISCLPTCLSDLILALPSSSGT
ncbi:retinol dehydrogenase 7 [Biomphalaria glabrata]|uniref:Retinol dehydrogenase n=1 Tax=Biomphalaria glabrata TaxID=6526 RepID=A0A2C9JG99_BIOGL|nr:retinol dehydrogenase 7 [Biomphalaria glabrata]